MSSFPLGDVPPVRDYLRRVGAQFTSVFRAAVSEQVGRYERELHFIRFNRSGEVFASNEEIAPTGAEQEAIATAIGEMDLPRQVTLEALPKTGLPDVVLAADDEALFEFWDRKGKLVMLQVRVEKPDGDKRYQPWTYWSDSQWRAAEPEDRLPIWGAVDARTAVRVFIHEGAKAARAAQRIAEDPKHPFHELFSTGAHVGWIGGAHAAGRADWRQIRDSKPSDVIIVPDNDFPGQFSVPTISRQFRCSVRSVVYDSEWPDAWDAADPVPDKMFKHGFYTGPSFESMLVPADWATDQVPNGNRMVSRIRETFAQRWIRIDQLQRWAHVDFPTKIYNQDQFNNRVAPYSHVDNTSRLLAGVNHQRVDTVTFDPRSPKSLVGSGVEMMLNQYVDKRLRPMEGIDTSIFWDFMQYLFPEDEEREHMIRWLATLYAHPDIRMGYGVLALSTRQGVGKSTIGTVAAKLIGYPHCSFPGDNMITQSDYNGWLVNKRLIVVHEIYAGQNWRAYNKLKTLITDDEIEANIKHIATYTIPNWTHFYCCSNSMEALRVERDDRRWFVPRVAEETWPEERYKQLWDWVRSGGLHGLAHDLRTNNRFVAPGEFAPRTQSKEDLIEASRPEEETMLELLMENLNEDEGLVAKDVWLWLRKEVSGRVFISPERASRVVKSMGYGLSVRRIRHGDHQGKQRILAVQQETADSIADSSPDERNAKLRTPDEVFQRSDAM